MVFCFLHDNGNGLRRLLLCIFFADVVRGMIITWHFFEELFNFGAEIEIAYNASHFIGEVLHVGSRRQRMEASRRCVDFF